MLLRRRTRFSLLLVLTVIMSMLASSVFASQRPPAQGGRDIQNFSDNLSFPGSAKETALRQRALQAKLKGQANGPVAKVAGGKYVELAREKTDKVFAIITEFGNTRHSAYPDTNPDGTPASDALKFDGPAHNSIPKPDRKLDNSTLWQPDYNRAHYEDMYFNRMAKYWESQSSGRYSVEGAVTEWVKVPFNEARYGRNVCGDNVCSNTWFLIRDAMAIWVQDQLNAGKTQQEITDYLKTFDVWDRRDFDGDGNFDEPDGYIDHFQIVHAGEGEETGGGEQATDAIWSHRWYVQINPFGSIGPEGLAQSGGIEIGQGGVSSGVTIPTNLTGVWVFDYTIQPENGGLGVFAHEYGHDLGLPDLYDTSGNTGGAENSTGFWTLYSSGSYGNDRGVNGIGDEPTDLGAWEKFQLGWLGCPACAGGSFYKVVNYGEKAEIKLGPANSATKGTPQALFVLLPDKQIESQIGLPFAGSKFYYSGADNDLDNLMYKQVTLPANAKLTAKVRYQIETDWDYAYVVVSTDNGATWNSVPTNLSTDTDPNSQNFGHGITGSSNGAWVDLNADLSGYTGNVLVGFRYWTDVASVEPGIAIDEISIAGSAPDGAEADAGWTYDPEGGFHVSTGTETSYFFNAYVGENRGYRGYDESLRNAYNFGFANTKPNWVEFFRYQDGLLISYWDESYSDNNVGDHPGGGLILPVDAHPKPLHWRDGTLVRPRIQSYDSTFNRDRTEGITLHKNGVPTRFPSLPAARVFDDRQTWWYASDGHSPESHGRFQVGWSGVNVPKTGTTISVKNTADHGFYMFIEVGPSK